MSVIIVTRSDTGPTLLCSKARTKGRRNFSRCIFQSVKKGEITLETIQMNLNSVGLNKTALNIWKEVFIRPRTSMSLLVA